VEFEGLTIISYNVGGISLFDIHGLIETLEMEQPWDILLLQEFGSFKEIPVDYIEHYVIRTSTSDVGFSPCYGPDGALIKPKRAAKSVGIIVHARHIPYVDVSSAVLVERCIKLDLCINHLHYRFISVHLDPYGDMEVLAQQYRHLNMLVSDVSTDDRVIIGMDSQCTLSHRKLGESPCLIGPHLLCSDLNARSSLRRDMLSNYARRNDLAFANTVCDSSELGGLHTWDGYRKINVVPRQIDYIMIDEASVLASDSWILDSAATSSDHRPVVLRLKGKVRRVWTPGAKGACRGKRLIAFQISKVEEFNDLVRESFPSQDVLSREPVTASPGSNVQSESKRSKRSRKSRIIDVDVTPCITLDTIQEDVPTYQSEPVESVFCSEAQRNLECSVGTFVLATSLQ